MRIYALERAFTREERVAELALAPHDLVGREAEKADLHAAYHLAVTGQGEIVSRVVIGEMGIGKTALVATFLSELPPDARVLRVECSPARTELPFGVVSEFVREAVGVTSDQSLARRRASNRRPSRPARHRRARSAPRDLPGASSSPGNRWHPVTKRTSATAAS